MSTTTQPQAQSLIAFHGKPAVKKLYVDRVKAHAKADLLVQGATGRPDQGQQGCAVACTLNVYDHYRYPKELGVPVAWAMLEDTIFENLPQAEAMKWPTQFLNAIPVGADLWPAYHRVTQRILLEVSLPSIPASEPKESKERIEAVIKQLAKIALEELRASKPGAA